MDLGLSLVTGLTADAVQQPPVSLNAPHSLPPTEQIQPTVNQHVILLNFSAYNHQTVC